MEVSDGDLFEVKNFPKSVWEFIRVHNHISSYVVCRLVHTKKPNKAFKKAKIELGQELVFNKESISYILPKIELEDCM